MEAHATGPQIAAGPAVTGGGMTMAVREAARYWWLWLVVGIAWIVAALVILQFNHASVKTVSIILGIMFTAACVQQFMLVALADHLRWLFAIFGVLFGACAVNCFTDPAGTFTGLANVLGFLFMVVGVWWMVEAFATKAVNPLWWLTLIAGVLLVILAFYTSGAFFIQRAYTLLVFAGIWALAHGTTDIIRAFQIRSLRDEV